MSVLDFGLRPPLLRTGNKNQEVTMAWNTPKVVEVALGAEINSYVCADLKK